LTDVKKDGVAVDFGGMWVGPSQKRVIQLADELGVTRFPQYFAGKDTTEVAGRCHAHARDMPFFGILAMARLYYILFKFERLVASVNLHNIGATPSARVYDSMTVQGYTTVN
jgi:monoamine oxidase